LVRRDRAAGELSVHPLSTGKRDSKLHAGWIVHFTCPPVRALPPVLDRTLRKIREVCRSRKRCGTPPRPPSGWMAPPLLQCLRGAPMGRRSVAIGLALALVAVSVGLLAQRRRDADLARIAAGADEIAPAAASGFVLPSLGGGTVALHQFRGKVLVVTFWASWCPPCRAEEPSLRRLTRRFSPESFQLLAV